jgi:cold-inducible RNA-binding protein
MNNKLYVGNLSYSVDNNELENMFRPYGRVTSVNIIKDYQSGRSKGFGFVEMSSDQEANAAISGMHGKDFEGKSLTVNVARPREERSGRGNGNFGSGRRY